jgi:selenocysteine-specific elongation factor
MVMLVIAADEGVMPQTREHLEICSLLGIRTGLVALTKTDMVEPDWLEMVTEDVRAFLAETFLAGAPIFPVSSATGEGVEALRAALVSLAGGLAPQPRSDIFRLPVDRVFSMKGHGTVVTGTVISGRCAVGDELCFMPSGPATRARSLQRHGRPAQDVAAGQRCAVNVQSVEVADVERGLVLAHPGELFPSPRWMVRLTCRPSAPRALRQRVEIHFHHGTRECPARVVFRDREKLAPGETALAELRFREPLAGVYGDHCVLRAGAPLRTVAGGPLVSPLPPELRRSDPRFAENLRLLAGLPALRAAVDAPLAQKDSGGKDAPSPKSAAKARDAACAAFLAAVLELRAAAGADEARLRALTGLPRSALETGLQLLAARGAALCFDKEARAWIGRPAFDALLAACLARGADLHRKEPLKPAFTRGALGGGWRARRAPRRGQRGLAPALRPGDRGADGDGLRLAGHQVSLAADQEGLRAALLKAHAAAGLAPPNLKEVLEALDVTPKAAAPVLRLLCESGELVKIKEGLCYHGPALTEIMERVRQWFADHDNLDVAGLKELTGLSRKYLIALLEYMDNARITVRVGDQRRYRGR